ncbi:MAG TPA: hypothetical protein VMT46_12645 [Anaerolineaceae bacterium]|nr:hypothetical protein [Anaerolineaceae bacterium]
MRSIAARLCAIILLGALLAAGSARQARGQQADAPYLVYFPIIVKTPPPEWIGPGGGRVLSLAINPNNPSILYAGTVDAGVFKSTDGGASWFDSSNGLGGVFIQSLAIDPLSPDTLYAAIYKDQLYKSVDGGSTWFPSSTGIQASPVIYSIAVDPKNSANVYIGTRGVSVKDPLSPDVVNGEHYRWNGELYKSNNFGATWTRVLSNIGGPHWQDWAYSLAIVPGRSSVIYAAFHENGPYRSMDNGNSWTPVHSGIADLSGRSITVDPLTRDPATVYFGVWHGDGVYKSTNGGDTWSQVNSGLGGVKVYPGSLAVDPIHPSTLYLGDTNSGVYKTANNAASWSLAGLAGTGIYSVLVHPVTSPVVFAGTQADGLYQSPNGGVSWARNLGGLHADQATGLVADPTNPARIFAGVNGSGVFVSTDRGDSWGDFNHDLPDKGINGLVLKPGSPNLLFALTNANGLYKIDAGAANPAWVKTGVGLPIAAASGPAFAPGHPFSLPDPERALAPDASPAVLRVQAAVQANDPILVLQFASSNPKVAYLGTKTSGLYKSSDGGALWSPLNFSGSAVTALAVNPQDPAKLFAVLNSDANVRYFDGSRWSSTSLGSGVYALTFSPQDPGTIFAATGNGVYRKTGSGNWVPVGLSGVVATALAGHPARPGVIFAGATTGAYFSTDNGDTWIPGPAALSGRTVQSISFDPGNPNLVYFSTTTHDVLRFTFP